MDYVDHYRITNSRRFEVLGGDGAMVLVGDDGQILNPTKNLSTDAIVSRALHSKYYEDIRDALYRDRIEKAIREVKREALDQEVQKIIANDKEHQRFLKWAEDKKKLKKGADDHFNYILHGFWFAKNLGDVGIKEPPMGEYNPEARNEYLTHIANMPTETIDRDTRSPQRKALDSVHSDYMAKIKKPQKMSFTQAASSGDEPEEPPE